MMSSGWETILVDCMNYCSGEIREHWHGFTEDHFHIGYPKDFIVNSNDEHDGYYMGDYGQCWISLEDFIDIEVEYPEPRVIVETEDGDLHLCIPKEPPEKAVILDYQEAILRMFWKKEDYRLVVGYDS